MTRPIYNVNHGGLIVNQNDIKQHSQGNGRHTIIFKNGATLFYPTQKSSLVRPSVIIKGDDKDGTASFEINNLEKAVFQASKQCNTYVELVNCRDTGVDLSVNSGRSDYAIINDGYFNRVHLDSNDEACINHTRVKGEGSAAQKDY